MKYPSLDAFLTDGKAALAKSPVAIVFAEDQVEVDSTLRHNLNAGFAQGILLAPEGIAVPAALELHERRAGYRVERTKPQARTSAKSTQEKRRRAGR